MALGNTPLPLCLPIPIILTYCHFFFPFSPPFLIIPHKLPSLLFIPPPPPPSNSSPPLPPSPSPLLFLLLLEEERRGNGHTRNTTPPLPLLLPMLCPLIPPLPSSLLLWLVSGAFVGERPYQTGSQQCSACPLDRPICENGLCGKPP